MKEYRRNNYKNETGFSLIELLVVVAVIGVLMSFAMTSLTEARKKGRDSTREQDIKDIQNSINIYATNNGFYPVCSRGVINGESDCLSSAIVADGSATRLPKDPSGGSMGTCGASGSYVYCYTSADGLSYVLEYALETDTISGKSSGWQTVTVQH